MDYWKIKDRKQRALAKAEFEAQNPMIDVTDRRVGIDGRSVTSLDDDAVWHCSTRVEQIAAVILARAGCAVHHWPKFTAAETPDAKLWLISRRTGKRWHMPDEASISFTQALYRVACRIESRPLPNEEPHENL